MAPDPSLDESDAMIIVNTETVPGHRIVDLVGLVQGNTIRAKHLGRDIGAGLKNLVGGELRAYTELMTEARREAMERMVAQARELGANAIVNVRFTTSQVAGGAAELYAYGTAVTLAPERAGEAATTIQPDETFATPGSEEAAQ
jgi:uncharacterized protein YbjQ (UPF0145 family)